MNQILFIYLLIIPSLIMGYVMHWRMHDIKKNFYRGYTRLVFIDTGDIIHHYGRKQTYKTDRFGKDTEYVIDQSKVKRETLFFNSKLAEPPKIEADINKFKYWIDSNVFKSVHNNKILETMMLIQENNFIKIILVLCVLSLLASIGAIYVCITTSNDINIISTQLTTLTDKLIAK